jgi:hypothetical protein
LTNGLTVNQKPVRRSNVEQARHQAVQSKRVTRNEASFRKRHAHHKPL